MDWTHVQSASAAGTNTTDPQLVLGSASAIGNLIVVGVSNFNAPIGTISDGRNTWIKYLQAQVGNIDVELWGCFNVYGASPLHIAANLSSFGSITVDEFLPPPTSSVDNVVSQGGTSTAPSSGNVGVSGNDLVYGVVAVAGLTSYTPGSGYTAAGTTNYVTSQNFGIAAEYLLNTTSNPASPGFTLGSNVAWNMAGVTFRSPTPTPTPTSTGVALAQLNPASLFRESVGYSLAQQSTIYGTSKGSSRGLPLPKLISSQLNEWYNGIWIVPSSITLATGLTVRLIITDDGTNPIDLGKSARIGVTPFNLSTALSKVDWSTAASRGTETFGTLTLGTTSGLPKILSIPIVTANLAGLAAGNIHGVRIRRVGDDAADTCQGRVLLLAGDITDT